MEQALSLPGEAAVIPGVSPQLYAAADFDRIAQLVRTEAGIVLSDKKKMLAYSRLVPLVRESGRGTFRDYLDLVERDKGERKNLIDALTTNHTYFNREAHHFEHFSKVLRSGIIERSQTKEKVRIWSAGSSSGEEIHTLMMYLLGANKAEGLKIARGDLVVLASDLADHAVKAAKAATYDVQALSKMPEPLLSAWCEAAEAGDKTTVTISPVITDLIRYRQLNLLHPWPFDSLFDVIFCRNVMIYFDGPTKAELMLRFAQQLKPGGYLYIGHSERVSGPALEMLNMVGATIYQRVAT